MMATLTIETNKLVAAGMFCEKKGGREHLRGIHIHLEKDNCYVEATDGMCLCRIAFLNEEVEETKDFIIPPESFEGLKGEKHNGKSFVPSMLTLIITNGNVTVVWCSSRTEYKLIDVNYPNTDALFTCVKQSASNKITFNSAYVTTIGKAMALLTNEKSVSIYPTLNDTAYLGVGAFVVTTEYQLATFLLMHMRSKNKDEPRWCKGFFKVEEE